jgi:hypothetical protein
MLGVLRFHLEPGSVHLRGAADIVRALLFAAELSPFATLLKRQFLPFGCSVRAWHDRPPDFLTSERQPGVPDISGGLYD